MSERIDRQRFCEVYVPMALKGATALAIANELGVDKETDAEKSQFISQKASNYRKELKVAAEKVAIQQGLGEDETKKLVEAAMAKLPRLKSRTRATTDFSAFLDDLLAQCDAPQEEDVEPLE